MTPKHKLIATCLLFFLIATIAQVAMIISKLTNWHYLWDPPTVGSLLWALVWGLGAVACALGIDVRPLLSGLGDLLKGLKGGVPPAAGALLLVLVGVTAPACVQPPPNLTPQAQVAFTADQLVLRVNELENAAISAATQDPALTPTARTIVEWCVATDRVLKQAPLGWQQVVQTSWAQLKVKIPARDPNIAALLTTVDAAVILLGGVR